MNIKLELDREIEVVRMSKLDTEGPLKAFCDITIFNTFMIKGLRVIEGNHGLFVGMPREKAKDGRWYEIVRSMSREIMDTVQNKVLDSYES